MEPTLKGAYAKHDRAVRHLRKLLREFTHFAKEHVEIEDQPPRRKGSTSHVQIVVKDPTDLLGSLEPIVGDCVQNLRAALDYLVYELAITASREKPKIRTQFPIATSVTGYWSGRHSVRPLLGPHRRTLRKLQPYQGHDPARHRLALLNRLSNQDKHRLLTLLVSHVQGYSRWPLKQHGRGEVWPLRLKKQLEVGHVKLKPDVSIVAWVTLEFEEEGRLPVIETLADLAEYVRDILDWFEPVVR